MVASGAQENTISVPSGAFPEEGERVYPMSPEGKRQAYILLAGVAVIWIFALWTLITILQDGISGVEWVSLLLMLGMIIVAPVVAWTLLEEASCRVITTPEGVRYSSLGGIELAYSWNEISAPLPKGRGRVAQFFLGDEKNELNVGVGALRPVGDNTPEGKDEKVEVDVSHATAPAGEDTLAGDGDEPETLLLEVPDRSGQIKSPLSRFLHRQAHGATLPVYGGLQGREELLGTISRHLQTSSL